MKKTLIYGVGNPYRCDDRIGLEVADILSKEIQSEHILVRSGSIEGMAMLDEIMGFDRVIFIDSIKTKDGKPGDTYKISIEQLQENRSLASSHGIDFVTAVRLGKKFGYKMPDRIIVYAIEIKDNESYGEECTEQVKISIPEIISRIMAEVNHD
ncbi:hydrogenase maturation protease [candidate division WOR-3 bacterium]|nr:hydrogenase maturation protease [candidate division WOR-3 bacterium]